MKADGYMVFEACDDYEQALMLRHGEALPPGGILDWCERKPREAAAVFATRADAKAAIARTEHYRLAFGNGRLPEAKLCTVVPVKSVKPVYPQQTVDALLAEVERLREDMLFVARKNNELAARAERAEAQAEANRRDAERYRYIAADHSLAWEEELDAAIGGRES